MAVDRQAIVKDVMGQDQKPLYAYTTSTVEGGKFAGFWTTNGQNATRFTSS